MCVACSLVSLDGLMGGGPGPDAGGVGGVDAGGAILADADEAGVADTGGPETLTNDAPVDTNTSCSAGSTLCSGTCVDTKSDNGNCGSCGNACLTSVGQSCVAGGCAPGAFLLVDASGYVLDDPTAGGAGTGLDQVVYVGPNPNQEWMVMLAAPGQYKILAANGLALTGPGANCNQVSLEGYTGAPEQLWSLDVSGSQTTIVNAASGNVLDDNGGGQGQQVLTCSLGSGDANQMWTLATVVTQPPIPEGTYAMVAGSGFALDDPGGGGVDQAHNSGANQQWSVSLVDGIQYKILSESGAAVTGATTDAALTLASYTGAGDQLWVFQANGSGYNVLNVQTGQAIDDGGGGLNISVVSWRYDAGNGNQVWSLARLVPAGSYALFDSVGFALDDPGGGAAGSVPDQSAYSGTNQQWTVTNVSGTLYEIASASAYALTSGTGNGTIAALSSYTGASSQLWSFSPTVGGYNVVNAGSGLVLDAAGGGQGTPCHQWGWLNNSNQAWTLAATSAVAPPIPSGAYVFVSGAGFALDDPSGGAVTPDQAAYSGANQNWTVTLLGGSEYKIISASGYALTSDSANGNLASLSSYTGAGNQLWSFAAIGGNTYGVVNVGTGLLLDDNGGGAGTVCNQWGWGSTPNQLWMVIATSAALPPVANGVYRFVDAAGFALDDPSGDGAQAAPDQVPYSGANQSWSVTLVTGFEYKIIGSDGSALTSGNTGLASYTGASDQLWSFVSAGGGAYYVINAGTGMVLDDGGGGAGVACQQSQWGPGGGPTQGWILSPE